MNVNGEVLQMDDVVKVKNEHFSNQEMQGIVVFKRSAKFLTYINLFLKRMIDVFGALIGIIFIIPLCIVIKVVNVLNNDYGSIFYSQDRIGLYGKHFKMYKFRSMILNAEEKLNVILENNIELKKEYETYKKLHNDPRITPIGKFLRKTSLDEFPQFINVLKGEMSLVGPRAYMVTEKQEMGDAYNIIIKCKPGITGYWQVTGRSGVTFKNRLEMDIDYYENHNLYIDMKLLFKTFYAVFKRNGAE